MNILVECPSTQQFISVDAIFVKMTVVPNFNSSKSWCFADWGDHRDIHQIIPSPTRAQLTRRLWKIRSILKFNDHFLANNPLMLRLNFLMRFGKMQTQTQTQRDDFAIQVCRERAELSSVINDRRVVWINTQSVPAVMRERTMIYCWSVMGQSGQHQRTEILGSQATSPGGPQSAGLPGRGYLITFVWASFQYCKLLRLNGDWHQPSL